VYVKIAAVVQRADLIRIDLLQQYDLLIDELM
jgi:hypothetical protein